MKKKLYLYLAGGLGNQLFQYSAARNIALKNKALLIIDKSTGFIDDFRFKRYFSLNLKKKKLPEYIVLLEPPCPFRNGKLIDKVIKFAIEKKATSVVTFKIIQDQHPIRVKKISKEGRVSDYIISEPKKGFPRQKQKRAYLRGQAVYVLKTENFTKSKNLYGENPYGLINDENITVNIDSYLDYKLAETISKDKLFKSKILLPEFKQFENLEKLITKKKLI